MKTPDVMPDILLSSSQGLSVFVDPFAVQAWLVLFDHNWPLYAGYDPITRCQLEQVARILRAQLKKFQTKGGER